ncbi:hypothetical protein BRAS3843_1060039 [Bradyrhizobium sp. STM 3843]|nr:hypothetical protein BRAS3843_1060039 [Bradyrhizobium sp. STM 3843]
MDVLTQWEAEMRKLRRRDTEQVGWVEPKAKPITLLRQIAVMGFANAQPILHCCRKA